MRKEQLDIRDRSCVVYCQEKSDYLVIQPVDENDLTVLGNQVEQMQADLGAAFTLAAFRIRDWNLELSPWDAEPVFGREGFGHGAEATLRFVTEELIPAIRERYGLSERLPVILGGYSLAGLFALWSAYQTEDFYAVAAVSPSVWFPGWREYMKTRIPQVSYIYLSLGDKEEKAKNPVMAAVGDCIREQYEELKRCGMAERCILEWNAGNHFKETGMRCAKGFVWCMGQELKKEMGNCQT